MNVTSRSTSVLPLCSSSSSFFDHDFQKCVGHFLQQPFIKALKTHLLLHGIIPYSRLSISYLQYLLDFSTCFKMRLSRAPHFKCLNSVFDEFVKLPAFVSTLCILAFEYHSSLQFFHYNCVFGFCASRY